MKKILLILFIFIRLVSYSQDYCNFFRITITGTNLEKLNDLKIYIDNQVDKEDKHNGVIQTDTCIIFEDLETTGNYTLILSMFVKNSGQVNKYKNMLKNKIKKYDMSGLTNVTMIKNDNCTHHKKNPQPDVITIIYEWTN